MVNLDYNVIVFTNNPNVYASKRLAEECFKKDLKFACIRYKDVVIAFGKDGYTLKFNGQRIPTSKSVILRGVGEDPIYNPLKLAIVKWYREHKSKILNSASFGTWPSLDKTTQHINLSDNNLPIAESYLFGSQELLTTWAKENYPFIAKDITGSCGISVFKIKNDDDLTELYNQGYSENIKIKTLIFQKFLESGEDLRVIVLGGKVLGGMKRTAAKGNYLTNYSQGGSVERYDIDDDIDAQKLALAVAKLFKLDYCGVDLMKNNSGKWVVLEVNRACQFEGFEKSTGINVASKVIEYLTNNST